MAKHPPTMLVKAKSEFVWHSHPGADDFFFVLKGNLTIGLRDGDVRLGPGDLYVVPKGVEHCPYSERRGSHSADRTGWHAQHRGLYDRGSERGNLSGSVPEGQ